MTPFLAYCVFCNSVRSEVGGAVTIVGVYTDNLDVPSFPGMFPSMTIYTKMAFPMDSRPENVTISVVNPDGSPMQRIAMPSEVLDKAYAEARQLGSPNAGVSVEIDVAPFTVKSAGRYLVNLEAYGNETTVGHLNFSLSAKSNPAPAA